MKLYLDSADARQWRAVPGWPPVVGVTTNPSLIHQAGLRLSLPSYRALVRRAAEAGLSELMLQLPEPSVAAATDWAAALQADAHSAGLRLSIKLPCQPDWLPTLQALKAQGLPILLTGVSNPVQLLWAQAQGADWVAPYIGRLLSEGRDAWALVAAAVRLQNTGSGAGQGMEQGMGLLAASIKTIDVFAQLLASGARAATVQPGFLTQWAQDPVTQAALRQFEADRRASQPHPEG